MLCSYSAGALCAIAEVFELKNPDILVGSSGSSGSLAYFVAGQYGSIKNIWTNLLATKKLISIKRFLKIMDLNYLVDDVFGQQSPLNIDAIKLSDIKLFISATEYSTGEAKFFTNKDDVFEALRASKAIPLITAQKVMIDGAEYINGSLSATIDVNIKKAIAEGATHIIVIDDAGELSSITKMFWHLCSLFANKNIKKLLKEYRKQESHSIGSYDGVNIVVIKPSRKLAIHSLDNKREHLGQSFALGFEDLCNSNDFKKFLQNYKESLP